MGKSTKVQIQIQPNLQIQIHHLKKKQSKSTALKIFKSNPNPAKFGNLVKSGFGLLTIGRGQYLALQSTTKSPMKYKSGTLLKNHRAFISKSIQNGWVFRMVVC